MTYKKTYKIQFKYNISVNKLTFVAIYIDKSYNVSIDTDIIAD